MRTVSRAVACPRRVLERGALRTSCARFFSAAVPWNGGLLGPTSSDQHYAKELDLKMAAELLKTPGVLWRAAEADVGLSGSVDEYLARVETAAAEFKDRNELHDRDAIMAILRNMLRGKGNLALVLGGKSVGKSFRMLKLEKELEAERLQKLDLVSKASNNELEAVGAREDGLGSSAGILETTAGQSRESTRDAAADMRPLRMVVYDARLHEADLAGGLLLAFSSDPSFFEKYSNKLAGTVAGLGAMVASAFGVPVHPTTASTVARLLASELAAKKVPLRHVVDTFVKECEAEGTFPCLVVDEANAALVTESKEEKNRTLSALRLLTRYTKQSNRMNVIFASSEYAEPYRLSKLSDHFTDTVLVPEVAPKEMRQLLEGKWGMGPNLASAFMSVWGGECGAIPASTKSAAADSMGLLLARSCCHLDYLLLSPHSVVFAGHIHAAFKGIERLAAAKESFAAIDNLVAFSHNAIDGVAYCVDAEKVLNVQGTEGMLQMLCRLAESGFVPIRSRAAERVRIMAERDVAGVVTRSSIAPGISLEHWSTAEHDQAVVPTNQAMRMLLARRLCAPEASADSSPPREA